MAAALGAVTVAMLALRIPSVVQPLGIDQGLWAAVARSLADGQELYRDVWDQKPPGIFLAYLAAFRAFGWSSASVAWLDLLLSTGTAALLFAIVRRLSDRLTGALAAALYATFTFPPLIYGHGGFLERAVNESHITLVTAAAAWFAARARDRAWSFGDLASAGACAGAAVVFKPNGAVYVVAVVAWALLVAESEPGRRSPLRWLRPAAIMLLASLAIPAAVLVWLWHHGIVREGWIASIDYNLTYVAGGPDAPPHWLAFAKAVWLRMKTEPLWMGGGLGALLAVREMVRRRGLDALPALAVAWGAAAALAIYANGVWLFNNYFVQALAPLAVLTAWLLSGVWRRDIVHRAAAWAALVLFAAAAAAGHYPGRAAEALRADLDVLRGVTSRTAYLERFGGYASGRGYSARANDELRSFVASSTVSGDRIYIFGINGVEVYFSADRRPAQRFLRVNYFIPGTYPDPDYRLDAVVRDLRAARPALLIFERLHTRTELGRITDGLTANPTVAPLLRSYEFVRDIEDFAIYRRAR